MVIQELRMKNFGKFSYRNIDFKDGINIVYGVNEAGKTTAHEFIKSMFFGIPKDNNLYMKYKPWERDYDFSGSIKIEDKGNIYVISRNFIQQEDGFTCINETIGENITDIGKLPFLCGMNETKYNNTISSQQLKSRVDKDLAIEVKRYIANLATANDKNIDAVEGLESLVKKKKDIEERKTEKLIQELGEQIEMDESCDLQINVLTDRANELIKEMAKDVGEKEAESVKVIKEYVNQFDGIKGKYKEYKDTLDQRNLMVDIDDRLDEPERTAKAKFPLFMISMAMILIIISLINFGTNAVGICASIGIMFISGAILYLCNSRVTEWLVTRECERRLADEQYCRENIENFNAKIVDLQSEILEYAKRVCPLSELNETEMCKLEQEVNVLNKQMEGYILRQQQTDDTIKMELELVNSEIERLKTSDEERQKRKKIYYDAVESLEGEKKDYSAILTAINVLEELIEELRGEFANEINPLISMYCNKLTNGRYSEIFVDNNIDVKLIEEGKEKKIEELSQGTIEQIYMSVRLATTQLFGNGEILPMILDDSFVLYDEQRLRSTLCAFSNMKHRQIIIFTCHKRETEILDEEKIPYNYVVL